MKRIIAGIMMVVMCIGLFSCSNNMETAPTMSQSETKIVTEITEEPKIDIIDALEFKNGETKTLQMNNENFLIYGFTDDSKIISEILSDYPMNSISPNENFKGFILLKMPVVYKTRDTRETKRLADDFYLLAAFYDAPKGAGFYPSYKAINCSNHEIVLNADRYSYSYKYENSFADSFQVDEGELVDAGLLKVNQHFSIS